MTESWSPEIRIEKDPEAKHPAISAGCFLFWELRDFSGKRFSPGVPKHRTQHKKIVEHAIRKQKF